MAKVEISDLLESTQPILYETGYDGYEYAFAGTCYPVKYGSDLFIISAEHCFSNHNIKPQDTLFPIPGKPREFYGFDNVIRAKSENADDLKHHDHIILHVSNEHHNGNDINSLVALDLLTRGNHVLPTSTDIKDIFIRGYPFDALLYGINYENGKIAKQAYLTNGILSKHHSYYNYCYMVKMKTAIYSGGDPNGMSGSPVYAQMQNDEIAYCGTLIGYNKYTEEYLLIGPEIIIKALEELKKTL
jgi:hypothetical protein